MKTDAEIIDYLGGPAEVARRLGYKSDIGTQRVHNWKARGIPAAVKLKHLDMFAQSAQYDLNKSQEAA